MQWLEITINCSHEEMEGLTDRLTALGVEGFITEDEADVSEFLEGNKKYWDYVDEDFLASMKGVSRVKFYLENSDAGRSELRRLRASLPEKELLERPVKDEDWENNWKEYYKPIPVGEKLLIVPEWEKAPEDNSRRVLKLDPGLIFGTGAHATTQMCLEALERYSSPGKTVLDLGCGSGILAIAALILGADSAIGCDIDEKAPPVVMENAALNGIGEDRLRVFAGDVLSDSDVSKRLAGKKFDIVTANIVADVIIAIAKKARAFMGDGGVFVCSGIIDGREAEVEAALKNAGFVIIKHLRKEDWHAFICSDKQEENMEDIKAIVLAAGKGTRMRTDGSDAPKVMRLALGKPLLSYVLSALPVKDRGDAVVVVGYMKEQVMEAFPDCAFAVQAEQLGTGHAVMCAAPALEGYGGNVLVCCGDTPLVSRETYEALVSAHISEGNDCTMLSGTSEEPMKGYGRVVRDSNGGFSRIVEERDCTPEQAAIREYNSGIYVFRAQKLFSALKELKTDNAQGEYYLTDTPDIMIKRGDKVGICVRPMGSELIGVNTPEQLKEVERILSER